ncbi:LuxR family maltose regulon positive regulatory protein [Planomicrobium soli]|uniref:LuxR family maltose regulon positive regulatory protein n=1 Tax=Planomicrobium soli TaxID=1176648 RepID=A0A2P8H6I6_9BACL|nr:LuxR C-terminal-related transcriptional regulator [Planomicrobium soli]PSL41847.1 LuxR family maltose regulon positive regulatory protein [Planomicrobium soli]
MNIPIIKTKLYIPVPRPNSVQRPRLIEQLNAGLDRKLTLLAASAGFGKTALASEWVAGCGRPVAWLSLDEGDSDLLRFLAYFIAALQTMEEGFGAEVSESLKTQKLPPIESTLTALLNEISNIPYSFMLVLDDYHVIESKEIDSAMSFLLEYLPPQMHLVIAARENPQLPLARLRARGHLTELRAADLRFTHSETALFLEGMMGLGLNADEISALESRTEGWVTGLQLAALSIQGRTDIPAFIQEFAGDNRYIVDYLVEEVLQLQPDHVRSFLLQTSILERLNGPLCDAVTGQNGGITLLETLERGNFFVVPLDEKRQWYRYHHLFAEVLYVFLKEEQADEIAALHGRASAWYEAHGMAAEAIRHALSAKDFARAANLLELAWGDMRRNRQEAAMLAWLKAIPEELIRDRPVLSVVYAWALLSGGELAAVEKHLKDAERWLETIEADEKNNSFLDKMVVIDKEEFRDLLGSIAVYRAAKALALGDIPAVIKDSQRVLDLVPETDYLRRGAAAGLMGLAFWTIGELETAHRIYAEGMADLHQAGNVSDVIGGALALADIRIAQGKLHQTMRIYERSLQLAAEQGEPAMRGTADMYVGMSELCRERNEQQQAEQHLLKSKEQGEHTGFPQNRYRWRVAMARIREAEGKLDDAMELLNDAEHTYVSDFFPNVRPIAALKVRIWLKQGRLNQALDWVQETGLSSSDSLSYLREFEHITLARVLLARYKSGRKEQHSLQEAIGLLNRLYEAAEEGGRIGSTIEILIVQALAHQLEGNLSDALMMLGRALDLAEPEGYVRIFVDEGSSMMALLEAAVKMEISQTYGSRLLAAFGRKEGLSTASQSLGEPLSERELDVLKLLRTDMSGPDIARELIISLNTMRTHTKNIYSKLEVNNRRAAIRRAEELGLF